MALRYSFISAFSAGPKHHSVMTTGRPRLLEHGQRRSTRRGHRTITGLRAGRSSGRRRRISRHRRTFQGLQAGREQWTPPPTPPGPQYLLRDYGPDGSADGLCCSTPRHADDSITRPSGSGPTRLFDARDSESSSTCQGPTRPRPGTF
jgi:hypothetical protein